MEVIVGIASKDFSKRAPLAGDGSMFDGVAAGLNMLAEEVGRLLGCSPKAVYARVSRGQLPGAFRVGRSLRFRGSELLPFILEGHAPSPRRSR